MALALVVLALGSVLAGYIGLPHALGGSNRLEAWLEPSLTAGHHEARAVEPTADTATLAGAIARPVALQEQPAAEAHGEHAEGADEGTELALMGLSSLIAFAGIGIAMFLFLQNPAASERVAEQFSGLRTLLLNKYYVDEVYDAVIVQPIKNTSEKALWKVVDAAGIDGVVNGTAQSIGALSELLRRIQTGSVRAYAASLLLGAVLVLGYYVWR
jgi:NADH-quinone oxidoreductase subunit L